MTKETIIKRLRESLSEGRFEHSLRVSDEAVKLADTYGADTAKAEIAGLIHDCARNISHDRAIELFKKFGIVIDDIVLNSEKLIHAPLGACIAQYEFEIQDVEILDAVWFHTTAKSNMPLLTKIIYIADYIEPGRDYDGVDDLRELAYTDLDAAVIKGISMGILKLTQNGFLIHPDSIHARNYLLMEKSNKS